MAHFLTEQKERFPRLKEVELTYSENDFFEKADTPAGNVDVMYFHERKDFENAVIALAYMLEKRPIPPSMGAMFLNGLVDRVNNVKVALVILSRGYYSAVKPEEVGLPEEEWLEKSFIIRKNHELAHFVQRKLFPENKDALKDEIKADMTGLIAAFGKYKPDMARLFLGTEGKEYRKGGRLENYVTKDDDLFLLMKEANEYIDTVSSLSEGMEDPFSCLIEIEKHFV